MINEKRERNIQTKRVPNDMHEALMEIKRQFRCGSLFDAMLYCTEQYLKWQKGDADFNAINAQKSTEGRVN